MTENKELPWMGALYRLTASGTAVYYIINSFYASSSVKGREG